MLSGFLNQKESSILRLLFTSYHYCLETPATLDLHHLHILSRLFEELDTEALRKVLEARKKRQTKFTLTDKTSAVSFRGYASRSSFTAPACIPEYPLSAQKTPPDSFFNQFISPTRLPQTTYFCYRIDFH
jgi:hypothetical protein